MKAKSWLLCGVLLASMTGAVGSASAQTTHTLPLVLPHLCGGCNNGLVRIGNRVDRSGTVRIHAIDDEGVRFGPVDLSLDAHEAVTFNSRDLEEGNASKGLPVGVGDGEGNWRLELQTDLDVAFSAYVRTSHGVVRGMQDVAPSVALTHRVLWFNPGSNRSNQSRLRLVNPGTVAATVEISARDDAGDEGSGTVRLSLPAGASRTLTAQQLERGFGDGSGKWRLTVTASAPIQVVNLLWNPVGHLSNVSTFKLAEGVPGEPPTSPVQTTHTLPLVLAEFALGGESLVRIGNRSDRSGTVLIHAIDDTGKRFGPVDLSLDAHEAVTFNSRDRV